MVSAVWFAWSKCPPLHPCCHCGSQAGQNNPESNSPSIYFTILSACRPVAASLHGSVPYRIFFFCPCQVLSLGPDLSRGDASPLWADSLEFLIPVSKDTHTHSHTQAAPASLRHSLCSVPHSTHLSAFTPPLFRAPCLLMPLWYCRVV